MCVVAYVYMSADVFRGQKKATDLLRLKLKVVMSLPAWVLGTKLRSFTIVLDL